MIDRLIQSVACALTNRDSSGESLTSGWGGAQTATVLAALAATAGVIATILTTSTRARRERRANVYAEALTAVADYMEGPYRIRRKDGTAVHRNAIAAKLSEVQSAIDKSRALLRLHARSEIADAFEDYVSAARFEAGRQMHEAWMSPPITSDAEMNLHDAYTRKLVTPYRSQIVELMQYDLERTWWRPSIWRHYRRLIRNRLPHPSCSATSSDDEGVGDSPESPPSAAPDAP